MTVKVGLDIGSTTIKAVAVKNEQMIFQDYRRHHSDVYGALVALFDRLAAEFRHTRCQIALTGSGGVSIARNLQLDFVQEVIAGTRAVQQEYPDADVIIELGGEDAKITFLRPNLEQRMNGTCAGGTGSFIDQMASLLKTDAQGLDTLAKNAKTTYTIASRCGVFAKSDLQPLLNEGAAREDLAASVFQAVVNQTIAGLACGRKIQGNIVFLGGPLHFMPQLRQAFKNTLQKNASSFAHPPDAQVYVAIGAAMMAEGKTVNLRELALRFRGQDYISQEIHPLPKLFSQPEELEQFQARHRKNKIEREELSQENGPLFLGIDAGSTTTKAIAINRRGNVVFEHYSLNEGNPVGSATSMLETFYRNLPQRAFVGHACVTGYGENLLKAALNADSGTIETVAHYRAAARFCPEVDFIVDIGGQDMKCMHIKDGVIETIILNEACSSGCGSFIQTFAEGLSMDSESFAKRAMESRNPVDLGTRCTVFMNSRVKQAQREGATVADISAGLSYSVVRNALYKVIKLRSPGQLGEKIVVQGGTFFNNAILRCFELLTGKEVIRPDIAGLMGAYGAALIARENWQDETSQIVTQQQLQDFDMQSHSSTCRGCGNYCKLTVSRFSGGRKLISGNRCEKGGGQENLRPDLPNLVEYKYRRLFDYKPLPRVKATRGEIGIPRALNLYENYPLWFTLFTHLGFRVTLSAESSYKIFELGMDTIPSESLCYPAKLAHGHITDLINKGVKTIFYPCLPYEQRENPRANNHYNCPIVTSYPEVIKNNVDAITDKKVTLLSPFLPMDNPGKMAKVLQKTLKIFGVTHREVRRAVEAGFAEYARFRSDIEQAGTRALDYIKKNNAASVVLAGRPYHLDPEINHGIPKMITGLGMAVLTEDSISTQGNLKRPLRVVDQWMYHSRLYETAAAVTGMPHTELVQLVSFGCGLDAVTTDQVEEILSAKNKIYTAMKIDEVNNLGAARIRMRSLKAAMEERCRQGQKKAMEPGTDYSFKRIVFSQEMKQKHTILIPQMSPIHFKFVEPAFSRWGYNAKVLEKVTTEDIEVGLKYVNNDACYPSIVVIGQLINALLSGDHDLENTSVVMSQTGGGCRATNYAAMLRLALRQAGLEQVPVVALSASGIEKNPGLPLKTGMLGLILKGLVLGDLLTTVLLRTRPYESEPGSAQYLYDYWVQRVAQGLKGKTRLPYRKTIKQIVTDFTNLALTDIPRKPQVGLVGEILVKYHPDANNHAIRVIESEGCEAVLPGLLDFFLYSFSNIQWQHKHLGKSWLAATLAGATVKIMELYRRPADMALKRAGSFFVSSSINHLKEKTEPILSCGNMCGEGWFLTGEMIELIEHGVPNIICAQPFACLPNHVTGKGMIKELRRRYPGANIVPIDYDPGASEVNQLNRIKLMISSAISTQNASLTSKSQQDKQAQSL